MIALQDEVIADSEDEESRLIPRTSLGLSSLRDYNKEGSSINNISAATFHSRHRPVDPSAISSFSAIPVPPNKSIPQSNISSFTANADASSSKPAAKPRPKPRPAYKGAPGRPASTTSSIMNTSDSIGSAGNGIGVEPSVINTTSMLNSIEPIRYEGGFEYTLTLADRAKMRSRNTTSAAKSTHTPTSSKTNIISDSKTRSNTKTKPKARKSDPGPAPVLEDTDIIEITSSEDELAPKPLQQPKRRKTTHSIIDPPLPLFIPMPDSQMTMTTIPMPSSSMLPPSDPPLPSTIPASTPPPPLPPMEDRGAETTPPSSPVVGKRKRTRVALVEDFDDMHVDSGPGDVGDMDIDANAQDKRRMPPPPPPFFVGSSSFPDIDFGTAVGLGSGLPDTGSASDKPAKKNTKEKEKKVTRKKGSSDAVASGGTESEFEDIMESSSRPKKQPKLKEKAAKKPRMEVVIGTPGKQSGTRKKSPKSKAITVDNAEDDLDPLALAPVCSASRVSPIVRSSEYSPARSSDFNGAEAKTDGEKKGKAKATRKSKENSNTRKVVAGSDEDTELELQEVPRKERPGSIKLASKKGTGRVFVLENDVIQDSGAEEEDDTLVLSNSSTRGADKRKEKGKGKEKGKEKAAVVRKVVDEDHLMNEDISAEAAQVTKESEIKENLRPDLAYLNKPPITPSAVPSSSKISSRAYSIPRKSTPMSELIRRVNSLPNSPFQPSPSTLKSAHSALAKTSRSLLSRIAPLHPIRRTPPPPPPPIPKAKERKTKKMLEMEEKWEDELSETVDGWTCLEEKERDVLRRRKKDMELGICDDD